MTEGDNSPVIDSDAVESLQVNLDVRIGSVTLPLAELQQIEPGAILTLEESAANQVEILAGEKTIARGEIVTVDDQLAVRILQILGSEPTGEE
jgi:flagellar motor switch protein FliN